MVIPKVSREDILRVLQYIDENGIPDKNKSARYFLVYSNIIKGNFYRI